LRLDSGTRVRIASATELTLDRGAVYVDSNHSGVVIRTPIGSVRDIGTQFEVRLAADRMRVRVREGRVDLQHGGATHSAAAGVELDADAGGGVTEHSIARSGADWEWVVRAAPPIHLDGRTLSEVVASVTRDEGVKAVWFDETSRNAASMRLHGDVPLTPEEALDTALVASGLTSRTDGDRLIIKRRK
jgi:ferric-dicitrate binding protein FerR (iron transport regulator)